MANILPVDISSEEDWDDEDYGFEMVTSTSEKTKHIPIHQDEPTEVELFRLAAIRGELETVKDILAKGKVKVDAYLPGDWSALMHAAAMGHAHVVEFLLENGANPNFSKAWNFVFPGEGCKSVRLGFSFYLRDVTSSGAIKLGANEPRRDKYTPLMAACASRHCEEGLVRCAEVLMRHGARPEACDRHRLTPLMYACKEGSEQLVRVLLDRSDKAAQDNQGWTALFWAVNHGHEKIVQLLLDHGVPQHLMDRHGHMAVDLALLKHLDTIARMLGAVEVETVPEEKEHDRYFRQSFQKLLSEINDKRCTTLKKEVTAILHDIGLKSYAKVFQDHNVDLMQFLTLTDERLKELGLPPRHRKRVLEAVEHFHFKPWKKSSIHIKPQDEPFSVHDGVIALCGTLRHVDLLRATVAYAKQRLESSSCKLDGDSQLVHNLRYYACHALHYSELLYKETLFLYQQATDIEKYDKIIPADLIVERKQPAKSRKLSTVVMGAVIVVMVWFHIR